MYARWVQCTDDALHVHAHEVLQAHWPRTSVGSGAWPRRWRHAPAPMQRSPTPPLCRAPPTLPNALTCTLPLRVLSQRRGSLDSHGDEHDAGCGRHEFCSSQRCLHDVQGVVNNHLTAGTGVDEGNLNQVSLSLYPAVARRRQVFVDLNVSSCEKGWYGARLVCGSAECV
jgi:hypothetical protein